MSTMKTRGVIFIPVCCRLGSWCLVGISVFHNSPIYFLEHSLTHRHFGFISFFTVLVAFVLTLCSYRLNLKGHAEVHGSGFCLDNECWRLYEHKVHSLMQEGLGDRVKFVRVIWRNTASQGTIEDVRV